MVHADTRRAVCEKGEDDRARGRAAAAAQCGKRGKEMNTEC